MSKPPKVEIKKITDLEPDNANANRGTERGLRMLDDSLSTVGAGRSIVVDKHGRIIGGNKTTERAIDNGFEDAIVVHTTGDKLVVVQRDDLDLYDPSPENKARLMAYYDNRVSQLDLDWNHEQLLADNQLGVPLDKFFTGEELTTIGVNVPDFQPTSMSEQPRLDQLEPKWVICPCCGEKFDLRTVENG